MGERTGSRLRDILIECGYGYLYENVRKPSVEVARIAGKDARENYNYHWPRYEWNAYTDERSYSW